MNYLSKIVFAFVFTLLFVNFAAAQNVVQPRQEKLLNGLKVLIWNDPKAEKISLKLRIHSGSAFDPKDKTGVMKMLGEILFPNEQTKIFFEEDLGGSLDVISNYDYIQINASGKSDDFLTILETLATAVSNPQITQENFIKVREARLKKVEELQKNPVYVADSAVAKRLLGEFPYGRPADGTPESLKLIDRADLLFAKDRFLTADNSTLVISGNIKPDFAYMATRRLFGAWKKSEKLVPATFRQPDAPDNSFLTIETDVENLIEGRSAVRGLARNDKDFAATQVLAKVLQNRLINQPAQINKQISGVRHDAHLLKSLLIVKLSIPKIAISASAANSAQPESVTGRITYNLTELLAPKITDAEFQKAKSQFQSEFNAVSNEEMWLDADTFKLVSVKDEMQRAANVAVADVQKVADALAKSPIVNLVVTKP